MEPFSFTNRRGQVLSGRIELPDGSPKATAIFAHCFTCSKNTKAASQVSRDLAALGLAVLRFDFTGLGNSEGDFANTNFSSNVTDLIDAADALRREAVPPGLLVGHSLGGTAALAAASEIDSIKAVASIGAPSSPSVLEGLFPHALEEIEADGDRVIQLGGRSIHIAKQFLDDLRTPAFENTLRDLRKPVILFHSPVDEIIPIENARRIYEAVRHPKSFVAIEGADHLLTRKEDSRFVSSVLAAWSARYVGEAESQ